MSWWRALRELLDGRSLRERLLVFAAAAGIVVLVTYQALLLPAWQRETELRGRIAQVRAETRTDQARIQDLSAASFRQKKTRLEEQRRRLRDQLKDGREALGAKVGRFIRPRRLMGFFEDLLLARDPGGIRVRRVESLPREKVDLGGGKGEAAAIGLFRKGVAVGYQGTFRETLAFLDRIEALPWAVQVTKIDYSVLEFPRARVDLTAHTFVLEPAEADRER